MSSHKCTTCGNPAEFKCPQCQTSGYCSQSCFQKDWKQHKVLHQISLEGRFGILWNNNINLQGKSSNNNEDTVIFMQDSFKIPQSIFSSLLLPNNRIAFGGTRHVFIYEIQEDQSLKRIRVLKTGAICTSLLTLKNHPNDLICGLANEDPNILIFKNYLTNKTPIGFGTYTYGTTALVELYDGYENANGSTFAAAYGSSIVYWDYENQNQLGYDGGSHRNIIHSLYFFGGKYLFVSGVEVSWDYKMVESMHIQILDLSEEFKQMTGFGSVSPHIYDVESEISSKSLVFSSKTNHLYVGFKNGNIMTLKNVFEEDVLLKGHTAAVTFLVLSKDEYYLFSCSEKDQTIRVWDLKTLKNIQIIKQVIHPAISLVITPSNALIASGGKTITTYFTKETQDFQIEKKSSEQISYINETMPNLFTIHFDNRSFKIPRYFLRIDKGQKPIDIKGMSSTLNPIQIYFILMGSTIRFTNPKQYFEMYLIFYHLKMWDYCYIIAIKIRMEIDDLGTLLKLFRISIQHFNKMEIFSLNLFIIFKLRFHQINRSERFRLMLTDVGMLKDLKTFKRTRLRLHPDLKNVKFPISYPEISHKRMRLLLKGSDSNVTLKSEIDSNPFLVHKEILILKSNFFYELMKSPFIESVQKEIIIKGFHSNELRPLLEFVYLDQFKSLPLPNFPSSIELLIHANKYFEPFLKIVILKRIMDQFSPELKFEYLLRAGFLLTRLPEILIKQIFTIKFDLNNINQVISYSKEIQKLKKRIK